MIHINLIKSQVPTEIDIPRKYKKPTKIIVITLFSFIIIVTLTYLLYRFLTLSTLNISTQKQNKNISKIKNKNIETTKQLKQEVKKIKKNTTKGRKLTINKKSKTIKIEKKEALKNKIKRIKKQTAVFEIALNFENIPTSKEIKKIKETQLPLPSQLKPQKIETIPKEKKQPHKNGVIYEITIKTTNIHKLNRVLERFKPKIISKKSKPISRITLYNVYVGGLYSYPKTLELVKILKEKGYKVYGIKNINLKYFILIDKHIKESKKIAYQKAWRNTPLKLYFTKTERIKLLYIVKLASPNTNLIKTLKKLNFYPIIKAVKNGA